MSQARPATHIAPSVLPAASAAQVWLDFDGTISRRDVLDELIVRFARDESWKLIEERWQAGQIGSRQCLSEEFALLDVSSDDLWRFIDTIELDPGAAGLVGLLAQHDVPVTILSDGVDGFIARILANHGLKGVAIRANAIAHRGRRLELACPNASSTCESGAAHCKCASARSLLGAGKTTIYVGDGRSDLCPARKAGAVFAKGVLAASLAREGRPFFPFATLGDVRDTLARRWATA
jgi:2,3-diketo-5-methylthio-1-phosphopentane phosphatase